MMWTGPPPAQRPRYSHLLHEVLAISIEVCRLSRQRVCFSAGSKMVWCLSPGDSFPGAHTYFFFATGTYTVGRKGCDVIVQADRGISRIHAKLVIGAMSLEDFPDVRIVDVSKYGTYVNKELGSKPVRDLPSQERRLEVGNLLTFGTATFRFLSSPMVFFVHKSKSSQFDHALQEIATTIGASFTYEWKSECTYVIADEASLISLDLIDAIIAKKPIVHYNWLKVLAEKRIRTELPSVNLHLLNLTFEGASVKIVEPHLRENCLSSHTFLLGSLHLYKFGKRLQSLLKICGGKVVLINDFCLSDQISSRENNAVVLVIPSAAGKEFHQSHELTSLSRVDEMKLVGAALLGKLDTSVIISPSILVSSSNSTNETIVADSDVEIDTATTNHVDVSPISHTAIKNEDKEETVGTQTATVAEKMFVSSVKDDSSSKLERMQNEPETSGHQSSDIIYLQNLIVRDLAVTSASESASKSNVVNFKCFRKREITSGNSFNNLVQFSEDPYKESECETDIAEYRRQEKKRKQTEALVEELFNAEKVPKKRKEVLHRSSYGALY